MADAHDIDLPNRSGTIDARLDTPLHRQVRENARLRRTIPSAQSGTPPRTPGKKSPLTQAIQGYRALTRSR